MRSLATVVRALPARWVLSLSDGLAWIVRLADRRGRRVGRQNLDAVFGDALSNARKREVLHASYVNSVRSILVLLHASPLTPERYRRWVDVPASVEALFRQSLDAADGGVVVSGHFGNWELMLGLPGFVPDMPPLIFLVDGITAPVIDRFLEELRGSGGGRGVLREGGARAAHRHVKEGGAAALLVDRNVTRRHGGIWVPFLGLEARTTPLPAWLALRHGVHVRPVFCVPASDGRYRIEVGDNVAEGVAGEDREAATLEITARINRRLERRIRAEPEIWNWTTKRFKSRPTRELGPYPPYSLWDA